MKWTQYLAVNRAFRSVEDRPTPFRMRSGHLLPRFGSEAAGDSDGDSRRTRTDIAPAVNDAQRPSVKGSAMKQDSPPTPVAPASASRPAFSGIRWRIWGNPFRSGARSKPDKAPVQGELRLDTIKVVRNDLTDSDLLLVQSCERGELPCEAGATSRPTGKKARLSLLGRVRAFLAGF